MPAQRPPAMPWTALQLADAVIRTQRTCKYLVGLLEDDFLCNRDARLNASRLQAHAGRLVELLDDLGDEDEVVRIVHAD